MSDDPLAVFCMVVMAFPLWVLYGLIDSKGRVEEAMHGRPWMFLVVFFAGSSVVILAGNLLRWFFLATLNVGTPD